MKAEPLIASSLIQSKRILRISNFNTPWGTVISALSPTFLPTKPWAKGLVIKDFALVVVFFARAD